MSKLERPSKIDSLCELRVMFNRARISPAPPEIYKLIAGWVVRVINVIDDQVHYMEITVHKALSPCCFEKRSEPIDHVCEPVREDTGLA